MTNTLKIKMRNEMPIFEYKCSKCKTTTDKITSYATRQEPFPCPVCFNGNMKFIDKIHTAGFRLKGDGWYESDFKNK